FILNYDETVPSIGQIYSGKILNLYTDSLNLKTGKT
ncbi:unnamed protein product, partial [marine sediment metagenome]